MLHFRQEWLPSILNKWNTQIRNPISRVPFRVQWLAINECLFPPTINPLEPPPLVLLNSLTGDARSIVNVCPEPFENFDSWKLQAPLNSCVVTEKIEILVKREKILSAVVKYILA